jgi:hypothetical protein
MKKRWFLFALLLGIGISAYFVLTSPKEEKPSLKPKHGKETIGSYFFTTPISHFTSSDLPCLTVQMDDLAIPSMLDLGFRGDIDFTSEIINQIQEKVFIGEKNMYGFRGKAYKKKFYRAPKIKIGKVTFSKSIMQEDSEEFRLDASIIEDKNVEPTPDEPGRIGWQLFQNANLFLDLGNSQIALCDSAQTLSKNGYPIEFFVKTPLLTERGLVEFEALTPNGPVLYSLDTGCTWNILNTENGEARSIKEMAFDPTNLSQVTFQINGQTFGPMSFHRLPINLPIKVEAMLGMEFFRTHQVFLDFAENQIYIRPLPPKSIQ